MFRDMRRKKQLLTKEKTVEILNKCMVEIQIEHMTGKAAIEIIDEEE